MSRQNRRTFLKRAAATGVAATFTIAGTGASGRVLGANDRVRVAVAGVNGRGRSHLTGFASMNDVEVAYIVDPDSRLFDSRSKMVEERGGNTPECVQDVRQALDDKNLDAVSIVTPNHWHTMFRESFESMKRHLVDAGQMDLANSTCRLGPKLSFDAQAEKFVGAPDANQLLSRPYRAPFIVPEQV